MASAIAMRPIASLQSACRRSATAVKPAFGLRPAGGLQAPLLPMRGQYRAPREEAAPASHVCAAEAAAGEPQKEELGAVETFFANIVGAEAAKTVTTGFFICLWYGVNIGFNLTNKSIYNYFPFPYTVSVVHVLVGAVYCALMYALGFKKASFGRPISGTELKQIAGPATFHALGHIASNLSFAAVAISLTHTVKTMEPVFSVLLSKIFLGVDTPLPVLGSLVPIMAGVAMASAAEVSFNWLGFISAMIANLTFGFRAVLSKVVMKDVKNLDGTALYAYTALISCFVCTPFALWLEGPTLAAGAAAAIEQVGATTFWVSLFNVGLLYHLYNQFAFNTLERMDAVSHGVCNVVKRIVIIVTSVLFFGNVMTDKTKIGTVVALAGTYLYSEAKRRSAK